MVGSTPPWSGENPPGICRRSAGQPGRRSAHSRGLDDLETLLLRADAGVQATDQVLDALRQRMNVEVVDPAEGIRFLKEQLRGLLDAPIAASGAQLLAPERDRLNIWLMVGVNGVGKTTTLGKLANLAVRSGYSALIAAADTFRAAAVQQVQVWGERSDVPVVSNPSNNADPAAVVFDARCSSFAGNRFAPRGYGRSLADEAQPDGGIAQGPQDH